MKQHGIRFFFLYIMPIIGILVYLVSKLFVNSYFTEIFGAIFVIGFLGNVFTSRSSNVNDFDGEMLIDTSDPTRDIYRLVLDEPLENLSNKQTITFKIYSDVILDNMDEL